MTQPIRKEPTFGAPTSSVVDSQEPALATVTETETQAVKSTLTTSPKLSVSIHSSQSPGHTFTPVMKRPVENASQNFATMEEQAQASVSVQESAVQPQTVELNQEAVASTTVEPQTSAKPASFAFSPVVEAQSVASEVPPLTPEKPVTPTMNTSNERIIPTPTSAEPVAKAEKVPAKYRRLILVALLLLALALVFFLLKPKAPETVEALQEQGTSLPIEFRPVDENEAKRAEEEARAIAQQQAQQQAQQSQPTEQQAQLAQTEQQVQPSAETAVQPNVSEPTAPVSAPLTETAQPVVIKPIVNEPVKKPEVSGSVIHQAEHAQTAKSVEKASEHKVERLVKASPAPTKSEPTKSEHKKAEPQRVERVSPAPTVKAQPAPAPAPKVESAPATPVSGVVASKTLTVPKGVSLMQVFRDNNLNISDVNAMSKVNGAVSNLKVGEKVVVRLDKNNRVAEMIISAGRYIRQANGSYIFK